MVDFRYHLVSIIAVFLALAVGIVVGTAALNGPIQDGLNTSINRLTDDKRTLEGDVEQLRGQVTASDEFAAGVAPELVDGALEDQRVLLVTMPETPGDLAEKVRPLLTDAGASITGSLEVRAALGEPEQRQLLEDLVAQVVPAGVKLPKGEPVERAAAELAAALSAGAGDKAVDAGEAQAVVSAFEEADLVRFSAEAGSGEAIRPATLVLVLAPPGQNKEPSTVQQQQLEAMLALADAFDDRSRGAVVAGPSPSALDGGLVRALRGQSTVAADVSTVDNADRGIGRVAVVLALAEQVEGRGGQYGAGPAPPRRCRPRSGRDPAGRPPMMSGQVRGPSLAALAAACRPLCGPAPREAPTGGPAPTTAAAPVPAVAARPFAAASGNLRAAAPQAALVAAHGSALSVRKTTPR
jgi:hypothetical protein